MKGQRKIKLSTEENMGQGLREVSWNRCPENHLSGDLCIGGFLGSSVSNNSFTECRETGWDRGYVGW